jgi:CRISPR-associated endonuclease/helicase Cas3
VPAPRKPAFPPSAPPKSAPRFEDCWAKTTKDGKPDISVRDHCLNVGCVAEALLSFLPSLLEVPVPQGAVTLAALHDIGKMSPGFQVKCETWLLEHSLEQRAAEEGWRIREPDHAKVSQSTVQNLLRDISLNRWAAAIGAHHGRIKGEQVSVCEIWEEERLRLVLLCYK